MSDDKVNYKEFLEIIGERGAMMDWIGEGADLTSISERDAKFGEKTRIKRNQNWRR